MTAEEMTRARKRLLALRREVLEGVRTGTRAASEALEQHGVPDLGDLSAATGEVRRAMRAVEPDVPVYNVAVHVTGRNFWIVELDGSGVRRGGEVVEPAGLTRLQGPARRPEQPAVAVPLIQSLDPRGQAANVTGR